MNCTRLACAVFAAAGAILLLRSRPMAPRPDHPALAAAPQPVVVNRLEGFPILQEAVSSGVILPGMRVDVVCFPPEPGKAWIVVKDVVVLSVDDGFPAWLECIRIDVTAEQGYKLLEVRRKGEFRLLPRPPNQE